jgi:hypothetical protein
MLTRKLSGGCGYCRDHLDADLSANGRWVASDSCEIPDRYTEARDYVPVARLPCVVAVLGDPARTEAAWTPTRSAS